jgi:hypothetical protein
MLLSFGAAQTGLGGFLGRVAPTLLDRLGRSLLGRRAGLRDGERFLVLPRASPAGSGAAVRIGRRERPSALRRGDPERRLARPRSM